MCTVTYLPLGKGGFVLTSNRDESIARPSSLPPAVYSVHQEEVVFPKDPRSGGTWIASSGHFTLCLLNGAFLKHIPKPAYRKSRGLVLLDFFLYQDVRQYVEKYDFSDIEPFTLVVVKSGTETALTELRWDGNGVHLKEMNAAFPHIWSSVTLYTKEMILQRENWFKEWLRKTTDLTQEKVLLFHHFGGAGDPVQSVVMQRENERKRTVSITSVRKNAEGTLLFYEDLLSQEHRRYTLA